MSETIAVLGAGSWGTALAIHLARVGHDVRLWARDPELVAEMAATSGEPAVSRGMSVCPIASTPVARPQAALQDAKSSSSRCPRTGCAPWRARWRRRFRRAPCSSARPRGSKPILCSACRSCSARKRLPGQPVVVLSGPSFAAEVARGLPTARAVGIARRGRGGLRAGSIPRSRAPALRQRRRGGRRDWRRDEERHRDRVGRGRRAGPRPQRDGRAHHARAGRDLAARGRRRRPARNAGRA